MTVAETLEEGVRIIIRCNALLFCIAGLGCPEVLPVGSQYGRQRLPMFLRTLAEETCRLGVGRSRTHHRIQGTELAQMLQVVDAGSYLSLHVFPSVEALHTLTYGQLSRFLIMQQLHYHLPLCILVEYHLQVGSHRQDLVHTFVFCIHSHQREQTIEIGIMPEAEVCALAALGYHGVGIGLNTLPK